MIETLNLEEFKTGLDLEKEFNKIVMLARTYSINHIEANNLLNEIYDYGMESGKFTKLDNKEYMRRRNTHRNGKQRTHLEFALNLSSSQVKEHQVFLYFIEWLKNHNNVKIEWDFNGSDYDGYIMISSFYDRPDKEVSVIEPDYKLFFSNRTYFVEAKSFFTPPTFKVANLNKYIEIEKCYLVFKYFDQYYSMGLKGLKEISKMEKSYNWEQETIDVSQKNINNLVENNFIVKLNE